MLTKKIIFLSVLLFSLSGFTTEILEMRFTEDAVLSGRVKDIAGPYFSIAEVKGSDVEIVKTDEREGMRFEREKKTCCVFVNQDELNSDFSDGFEIEITFLFHSTQSLPEKIRGGIHTLFSKYEISAPNRTFSIHLIEDKEKAGFGVTLSDNGQDTVTIDTPPILEPGKIYTAKVVFYPGSYVKIYIDGQLRRNAPVTLNKLFTSTTPVGIGCRFYGTSPINFFNGVIFNLKMSSPEKKMDFNISNLPDFVNWSLSDAFLQENGIRGAVTLNGWWKWMPAEEGKGLPQLSDNWLWRKVPGIGKFFHIKDSKGNKMGQFNGSEKAWIEREFTIPSQWKDRVVFIEIGNTKDGAEVFIDGKKIGITMPNLPATFKLQQPYKERYRITLLTTGVTDNVWLKSYPPENKITDYFIVPSYKEKNITVRGAIEKKDRLNVTIRFYSDGNLTKEEKRFNTEIDNDNFTLIFPWDNPKLWSFESPHLYWFTCEISSKEGRIIDKTLPERFGFREFWIEDGNFYLNGNIITLRSDSNVPFTMSSSGTFNRMGILGNEPYIRNILKGWKNLGLNSFHVFINEFLNPDVLLDICDEYGYYVQFNLPVLSDYAQFFDNPDVRQYVDNSIGAFIKRIRQHPSVLFYFASSGSHVWDYAPSKLDGSYNPDELWGRTDDYNRMKEIIERYDNTRPISYYSGGARGPIHTTMGYINFDADLQVHENWPLAWSKKKPRPLLPTEFSLPYIQVWYLRPSRGPGPMEKPIFVEWASLYFGSTAFQDMLQKKEELKKSKIPGQPSITEGVADQLHALFTKNVIRAWRTYGVSFALHAETRRFFKKLETPAVLNIDPRVPFYVPDEQSSEGDPFENSPLNLSGIAAKESLSRFLAYIGGAEGKFTLKDHNYFAGQTVKKNAILINDTEKEIEGKGLWEIIDSEKNEVIFKKEFNFTLLPGQRDTERYTLEYKAPDVNSRNDYLIKLNVKTSLYGITDSFTISIFPKVKKPLLSSQIYLYDPVGDTKKLLDTAEIRYKEIYGKLPNDGVLIIGRKVLADETFFKNLISWQTERLLYGIDPAISGGLKMLVFEQPMKNILGLTSEERRWRHAHITAEGHPVFKNLQDKDFSYLKGDSNLMPDYPDIGPPPKLGYAHPERFWMWGNDNVVTTFPVVKPQVGAYRSLLSCGFDLMETPLVEFAIGKGRIIFCQVDVTNRYGNDPVSTILVNNLLEYLDRVESPDPAHQPIYADENTPGIKIITSEDYLFVPQEIPMGLTISDFYFREVLPLKTISTDQGNVLFVKRKEGNREVFYYSIHLRDFKTRWQRMKIMRIIAALRINQGGSSNEGPSFILQGDDFTLYPINWIEGFVHPYLHWRW